jgi:thiamine-phosphate pyrophosphorylase
VSLPPLYAILDHDVAARQGRAILDLARACLDGGVRLLQVRAPGIASGALLAMADATVALAAAVGARVIVNDRADIAVMAGASGVHVGQLDLRPAGVRAITGPGALVGISTHTREQIDRALDEPVSYIAVGPVFGTKTKETGYAAVGPDLIAYAATRSAGRLPIVGIGGITLASAPAVLEAGAASVAIISDLLRADDVRARTREYVERLGPARAQGRTPQPGSRAG